jgi:hypothetical protein
MLSSAPGDSEHHRINDFFGGGDHIPAAMVGFQRFFLVITMKNPLFLVIELRFVSFSAEI